MVAGLVTILCHRFKQPVVLGYIVAGVIIGPHTPPFPLVHDEATVNTLAELGVVLLMFALGLEFNLRKLHQVGGSAFLAAFLEILLMVWLGYEIGRAFGWNFMDSVFLGAILSISSTTIIIKALGESGKTKERFAQLIFGILIIEDILGIAMIALLSGIAMTGKLSVPEVGGTLGRLGIFLIASLVVGLLTVPRLFAYVARFKNNEILLVTALALCFGFSLLAQKLGYSVALGAFLIGAVIAEAREIHRIEGLIEPVRDMFSAIFFVTIGLLIDPQVLATHWRATLAITVAVVLGKVITCSFGSFLGGNDLRTSLRVGMGLAQIGEFSFIIAALGLSLRVTSDFLYPIAVAVSVITTLLTPYLIRSADGLVAWFDRSAPRPVTHSLELYTRWVGQLGATRPASLAARLTRKWIAQIALNAALIAALFIAAVFVGQHPPGWLLALDLNGELTGAGIWLGTMLLALPLLIATFRKLQALGLLVAETRVRKVAAGERTAAIRAIVAQIVPLAGSVALALYVVVLSSALLPAGNVLVVLLAVVALVAWLFRRYFIRVYAKAQFALQETFSTPHGASAPDPVPVPAVAASPVLTSLLRDAVLSTVSLSPESRGTGKLIRELQLRTLSGASIVGIDRQGTNLINPGPDEELLAGDQVLLIGSQTQVQAAQDLLTAPQPAA